MPGFDPDAAAPSGSGAFGLPHARAEADLLLVPAPFDATASYRPGAARAPGAILEASRQVDLFDLQTGEPYRRGIHMLPEHPEIAELSRRARALVEPVLAAGGAGEDDAGAVAAVDQMGGRVGELVRDAVAAILREAKIPGVVGGDHSVAFGGIRAAAERHAGLGVLQIDAHADLRPAFGGFAWSHASVMHNVLERLAGVARIVQVGVRDLGATEWQAVRRSEGRVVCHSDPEWQRRLAAGEPFLRLCEEAVAPLPESVWVSCDVDGLDPALCPHTGTPVPGGLGFAQVCLLLETLASSGRRIVGFDLCEVVPGPPGDDLDAIVGARLLYKLCGFALLTG